jgi:hypothetical protein
MEIASLFYISAAAVGSDDQTVVAGTTSNGTVCYYRVLHDGSVDRSLKACGVTPYAPDTLVLGADGRIFYSSASYANETSFGSLQPDGTPTPGFSPKVSGGITSIIPLSSGDILISGYGRDGAFLKRLHADGSVDSSFNAALSGIVAAMQPDGKILTVTNYGTVIRRLNSDGSLDPTFEAILDEPFSWDAYHRIIADQPGGCFVLNMNKIIRYRTDGIRDRTFYAEVDHIFLSAVVASESRLVVSGAFTTLNGALRFSSGQFVAAPMFDAPEPLGENVFSAAFQENGTNAASLEFSRNLRDWQPLGYLPPDRPIIFDAKDQSMKFFRLKN